MKAIQLLGFGGPEVLELGEAEAPAAGPGRVLIRVHATSVNRPDIVQRQGHYPAPPGESPLLGLEAAGTVEAVGTGVTGFQVGERVFALLGGGGYAELAAAHAGHIMRIPANLSFEQAACICETYLTAYMNLFLYARLADRETVLLHGGGGGVTTAALQLIKALAPHARILVTASPGKVERVTTLGADLVIDYKKEDFAEAALRHTEKRGVDVILDHLGGPYLAQNVRALAVGGRLALIGVMGGRKAELDVGRVLVNRLSILGSTLRTRPIAEKAAIIRSFERDALPHFASGRIVPLIHRVYPLAQAADAHRAMEASEHFGKLVLRVAVGTDNR
ncbi:MAG TPA: NAD(P)H-quinone oxidoreductase [Gammaproteobacteria bacterium]|nr:NAD(P)H-quinone oxidoreductase [Gammaproteobacteria bacterium]